MKEYLLDDLFGSPARVKLVKFFIRNPETKFAFQAIRRLLRVDSRKLSPALKHFVKIRFIFARKSGGSVCYLVNKDFALYPELRALVTRAKPTSLAAMTRALRRIGNVKLAAVAGIFLGLDGSRADLLIVGDRLNQQKLRRFVERFEAEVGRQINVAVLSAEEFYYRLDMYDKFLRDMLEYRHEKLINKLKI